jgi:hypothetical protein
MPKLDFSNLSAGLSRGWAGYLRDWDRLLLPRSCLGPVLHVEDRP